MSFSLHTLSSLALLGMIVLTGVPSPWLYIPCISMNLAYFYLQMINENAITLQEKLSALMGTVRQMADERLQLMAEIDVLKKEKDILLNAIDQYADMEINYLELKEKNVLLESQINSLIGAIEQIENEMK